jgi:hypothetical protein
MKKDETLSLLKICRMKKWVLILLFTIYYSLLTIDSPAQCSICTKTAQQLGEKPAQGLNSGILYLAFAPFAIAGFVAYRWWKNNGQQENTK